MVAIGDMKERTDVMHPAQRREVVPPDGVSQVEGAILVEAQVLVGILRRKARELSENQSGQQNGLAKANGP